MERTKKIIKVSIMGIIMNIILVIFKAIVGLITNSIAITLDAVNNLSDVLSSVITIIGTKLSGKKPDKEHPYGHGRIEYFASVIIAIIVMFAGITSLKESVLKIINPEIASYSIVSLVIIIIAVFVKLFFGIYVKKQGEILKSGSLIASGTDALSDSVLSLSTFIAAVINLIWHISLEGYLGIIISVIILKSSIQILKETLNEIIGTRADDNLAEELRKKILSYEKVLGVYDLIIHNYGPNKNIATAHIQVDDEMKAKEIHRLTRNITVEIYKEFGIIVTLGIYASNDSEEYAKVKKYIIELIKEKECIIQMHAFYIDEETKLISFDLVFNFEEKHQLEIVEELKSKLKAEYPEYEYSIIIDIDYSVTKNK